MNFSKKYFWIIFLSVLLNNSVSFKEFKKFSFWETAYKSYIFYTNENRYKLAFICQNCYNFGIIALQIVTTIDFPVRQFCIDDSVLPTNPSGRALDW